MATAEPILEGRHLTRTFGSGHTEVVALANVSVGLFPGEIALLMRPSGCGKSTLLAVLSGLLRASSGQVQVLGQDLWALSESQRQNFRLRHFGFIFQGYNLFPALTARQQLEIVLRWGQGLFGGEARHRADELLALLGLEDRAHERPAALSGGEKQRLAVVRALVKEPTFCFADEPTSALDWENGQQVVQLLRKAAHERQASVLVVGHDARMIPLVDRLYYLEDGHLCDVTDRLPPGAANAAPNLQQLVEGCHEYATAT